jgi:hypothetical protein
MAGTNSNLTIIVGGVWGGVELGRYLEHSLQNE